MVRHTAHDSWEGKSAEAKAIEETIAKEFKLVHSGFGDIKNILLNLVDRVEALERRANEKEKLGQH